MSIPTPQAPIAVLGIDFTSAPSARKPITCALCAFDGARLTLLEQRALRDFAAFEALLHAPGPWVGGFDFPFGLPRPVVAALGWPTAWAACVRHLAALGKAGFEQALTSYKAARPYGLKEPPRATDRPARSRSPLKLFNPPTAKMFFQGAPRLLESGASILPCRPADPSRVALEAYPALLARSFVGPVSYKNDDPRRQTAAQRAARQAIVDALRAQPCLARYGFSVALDAPSARALVADPSGDLLDALACAVQAAWAAAQPDRRYAVPAACDPLEGWIVDPSQPLVPT
jgi:hypothetical protein